MSLVSFSIPNLINGISQQAFTLRLASQAGEQLNGLSSVVDGLKKRPPSRHVAKISSANLTQAFLHTINRDKTEQYELVLGNGTINVYDLAGVPQTVNAPDGLSYLTTSNPRAAFSCVTVADYTFIVNKERTVQESTAKSPTRAFEAMIWVRQGAYSSQYKIEVADQEATFTTPAANVPETASFIQTTYIAGRLAERIAEDVTPLGITVQQLGSVIYLSSTTADFRVAVYDPLGDTALKLIKGSVQRFSDLPAKAVAGFICKVAGSADNNFDDYWVTYEASTTNPYGGVWKEAVKANTPIRIGPASMPHLLVREADGTFSFEEAVYEDRKVGDLDSNPWPSFVGQKISDVFFHRNRLGFLSGENIVMSQASEFFRFFKSSAIQTVDTDPIDVAVSHTKVSFLKAAVPFNETLLLFSDQTQFQLGKADLLTPRTIAVNVTTEFACDLSAKPAAMGTNVYFTQARGSFSAVREYYVDPDSSANDAADVTAHCPKYIPGTIKKFAATSNEDMLVALTDADPSAIYVYKLYWNRQEKLQSSWSRWAFEPGCTVLNADWIESKLVLIVARADGTYIETIDLGSAVEDPGLGFQAHLDRRFNRTTPGVSATYNSTTDETTVNLPYPLPAAMTFVSVAGNPVAKPGAVFTQKRSSTIPGTGLGQVVLAGNSADFVAGIPYTFRYVFSPLMVREQASGGQGTVSITEGRVQVRKMSVTYSMTGYFRAEVTPTRRATYRYLFTGRVLGSQNNVTGKPAIETGTFQFPVSAKNDGVEIALVNDSYLPCAFLSADWEAFFVLRSRRG